MSRPTHTPHAMARACTCGRATTIRCSACFDPCCYTCSVPTGIDRTVRTCTPCASDPDAPWAPRMKRKGRAK